MSDARFNADCKKFFGKLDVTQRKVYRGVAEQMLYGIKNGSGSSGAPGQPVDTGYLKNSWQIAWETEWEAVIGTPCSYARVIESGGNKAEYDAGGEAYTDAQKDLLGNPVNVGRKGKKSTVGGAGSVMQTRLNFDRIVRNVVNEVVG